MAKNWYPVIDYDSCVSCGSCTAKCTHDVYDKKKAPAAHVVYQEGCVDQCHGCGNLCPNGSITYFGDETGWVSPNL